ncbi:hypothetical protein FSP39_016889 [Pinctada imbricata]|uniref:Vitellogenin domain-containing protein n=1 Tax=Pinctada imbricata TaxID=66713 RepID=A0AA88XST4_PINIB|nr:hypothetical protein FSP39_016889 [Pinctada imbricata]
MKISALALSFSNGKTYKYRYETSVEFGKSNSDVPSKAGKTVGYKLTTEFDLTPVFQAGEEQLLKIQFTSAAVASVSRQGMQKELISLLKRPIYFEYTNGIVGKVYAAEVDSVFCSNVKKGVISLFQVQETEGQRDEIDVSGECNAYYTVSGNYITKTKQNCQNLEIGGQFSNLNEVLGITVESSLVTKYKMDNGIISSAASVNKHKAVLNARTSLNAEVIDRQTLEYTSTGSGVDPISANSIEDAVKAASKGTKTTFPESLLPSGLEIKHCRENCEKPIDVLGKLKDDFDKENLSKVVSGKAFLKMLRTFRNSGKITIEEVMTHSDSYSIVPQLLDVGAATQTQAAQQAMMQLVGFDDESSIQYPERLLFALAYSTHPGEYLLQDLMALMKKNVPNISLRESIALCMGAVVHTFCKDYPKCTSTEVVTDYILTVRDEFSKCPDEACKLMYLRSIGNSGLMSFIPLLVKAAGESQSATLALTAVQAFRRYPIQMIKDKVLPVLQGIFHQNNKKHDSSVRLAALEYILRSQPSIPDLRNILLSAIGDQEEFEVSTFIIKRISDIASSDSYIRSALESILSDQRLNNYNLFAQKGKSSAFSSFLAVTRDANSTYGLYQENTKSGVMKKSAMAVDLVNKASKQHLLTFGIYAEGMEALVGDAPEGEESSEATAGLALTMMDVLLRPVEFFRGTSGLMSAVWNAPSEPVSALQGNLLLQDHFQKLHLSNGLIVDLSVLGVASIDLSGSISISLWYKNSHSVITNSGALVVEGTMKLDSDVLKAGISFSAETEAKIDFQTDVNFADMPFKMCLQMKRPPLEYREFFEKFERSRYLKKRFRAKSSRKSNTSPVSYFINEKNSQMCRVMDPDQE